MRHERHGHPIGAGPATAGSTPAFKEAKGAATAKQAAAAIYTGAVPFSASARVWPTAGIDTCPSFQTGGGSPRTWRGAP